MFGIRFAALVVCRGVVMQAVATSMQVGSAVGTAVSEPDALAGRKFVCAVARKTVHAADSARSARSVNQRGP